VRRVGVSLKSRSKPGVQGNSDSDSSPPHPCVSLEKSLGLHDILNG